MNFLPRGWCRPETGESARLEEDFQDEKIIFRRNTEIHSFILSDPIPPTSRRKRIIEEGKERTEPHPPFRASFSLEEEISASSIFLSFRFLFFIFLLVFHSYQVSRRCSCRGSLSRPGAVQGGHSTVQSQHRQQQQQQSLLLHYHHHPFLP